MANSIYCSPTHLKLIVGDAAGNTVKIRDFAEIPLPEGGMINGIVTDEKIMTKFLGDVNDEYGLAKEATFLVIHNNSIQTKRMDVPPVSESKILEFVQREFAQYSEEKADGVFDFVILNPKAKSGGVTIFAVGAGKELIRTYRTVLVGAGYDLKGINIGANCQIKLSRFLPGLRTGTYILVQIDGRNMFLTLFEEGEYRISNSYRLISNPDVPEWFGEVGNNLSSMIQFSKGQRSNTDISSACFAGVTAEQLAVLQENLAYLGIDIAELDFRGSLSVGGKAAGKEPFNPGTYLFNIGNLLKQSR
ncbi:MAG: hypothetical protein LBL63_06055 [Clostridiales Family XIII bacterium]|jgi:Tfp pilus assembly PilM family ATPase|nr:hypothetical protein [Clostridiales Family XIII bacterium]